MTEIEQLAQFKAGTGWVELEVIAEPTLILTVRGYAPVLRVKQTHNGLEYLLYISAKSLAAPLEACRKSNNNLFAGITFRLKKESKERSAKYEFETS